MATIEMLTRWRRDLHRIPEIDFDVDETLAYVRGELERMGGCTIVEPSRSALVACFGRGGSHAVGVRAELDALPVTERTGAAFASTHPGRMHACGHDGHMAMALGLAHDLATGSVGGSTDVLVIFEPAEETTGGARDICSSGVLAEHDVEAMLGMHVWPELAEGSLATKAGPFLAASNEVTVTFHGRASHIAKHEEGADALLAAAAFAGSSIDAVEQLGAEDVPSLLRYGRLAAGEVRNQIAATAQLEGSLRSFDEGVRTQARRAIVEVADACAAAQGCSAEVTYSEGYPVLVNDARLVDLAREALPELDLLDDGLLITDDFSYYARELPGLFLLLGTGRDTPLHSDAFDFDERILATGLDAFERLVERL